MSNIKEIHVVPNTHWDREFRESFEKTRDHLLEMMDTTIEIMLSDPEYKYYTLDAHCILVDDYLEMRPEMKDTVIDLIRARRLLVGPWYTLPDSPNIGAEALTRNFLWARKFADRFGIELMKVGYTPCNWGQPSQLPQIFKQLGIDSALFYRGISPHECPAEFIWVAPDGSEIIGHRFALFARYNWYYLVFRSVTYGLDPGEKSYRLGNYGESSFRLINATDDTRNLNNFRVLNPGRENYIVKNLIPAIEKIVEIEGDQFIAPYFLAMHGHDSSVAHPMDPKAITDANRLQNKYKVIMSNLEIYMGKLREYLKGRNDMVRLYGERRMNLKNGFWTRLLSGTISARTYLKMDNARTEHMLSGLAEPLSVMAMVNGADYPVRQLERSWQFLLDCHTHDAIAGCAPDVVCANLEYRFRQSRDLSEIAAERSMQHIVRNLNLSGSRPDDVNIAVFNTLPFARSENAQIEVAFPADIKPQGIRLMTQDGKNVEYQMISAENDCFFVDSIWDAPKNTDVVKFTLIARFNDIPALGYKTFKAMPQPKPTRTYGSLSPQANVLENRFLRMEVRTNGTIDVLNKKTGKFYKSLNYFCDEGVAGSAWKHVKPKRHTRQNSLGCQASIALVKDGALEARIQADLTLIIPEDLENRETASGRMVELPISTSYTLRRDDPGIYVKTKLNNTGKDHWLRAVFPSSLQTDKAVAETHFDLVERDIVLPDCSDWVEDVSGTGFMQTMVSLSDGTDSLSVFSEGLYEYEVFDKADRPIALTLLRAVWIKLEVSEEKKQILPDLGIQCLGEQEFQYVIYPHQGTCLDSKILQESQRNRTPVYVVQAGRSTGDLPLEQSVLDITDSDVIITCIKKAEDSDAIVMRGYNPKNTDGVLKLKTGFPIKSALSFNIVERNEKAIKHGNNTLKLILPKKRIFTLGLNQRKEE